MRRQAAERAGRRAETIAAWWLRLKGYRILAQRVRTPVGEIDLVARRGKTLAFVEVKARPSRSEAGLSITPSNAMRISRASNLLLARFGSDCVSMRIDAVLVTPRSFPVHVEGAWVGE